MPSLFKRLKATRSYWAGALIVVALVAAMVAYQQVTAGTQRPPGEATSDGR